MPKYGIHFMIFYMIGILVGTVQSKSVYLW